MTKPYMIAVPYGSLGLSQVPKSLLYKPFSVVYKQHMEPNCPNRLFDTYIKPLYINDLYRDLT